MEAEIRLALGDARLPMSEQNQGLDATLPTGACRLLGAWHMLGCYSVASPWLFQSATIYHADGGPIGTSASMLVKLSLAG